MIIWLYMYMILYAYINLYNDTYTVYYVNITEHIHFSKFNPSKKREIRLFNWPLSLSIFLVAPLLLKRYINLTSILINLG